MNKDECLFEIENALGIALKLQSSDNGLIRYNLNALENLRLIANALRQSRKNIEGEELEWQDD